MTRNRESLPASYFEDKYRHDIDPWTFRTSDYEKSKYAETIDALTRPIYHSALEVGCSIGVFTALLSPHCDYLLAIDVSTTAIAEAKRQNISNVSFEVKHLPSEFPPGLFDLIVLSEVLYYFRKDDLQEVARLSASGIAPAGEIILCHWLGETDYPLTGQQASDIFAEAIAVRLPVRSIVQDETFRLERFST